MSLQNSSLLKQLLIGLTLFLLVLLISAVTLNAQSEPAGQTTNAPNAVLLPLVVNDGGSAPTQTPADGESTPTPTVTPSTGATPSPSPTVPPSSNQPPAIQFEAPSNGQVYPIGETVNVSAVAGDPDGTVAWVELYVDDAFQSRHQATPYEWSLPSLGVGTYTLRLVAADNEGMTASTTTTIQILEGDTLPLLFDPPQLTELGSDGQGLRLSWTGCAQATSFRILYGIDGLRPTAVYAAERSLTVPSNGTTGRYRFLIECYDALGNSIFGAPAFIEVTQ